MVIDAETKRVIPGLRREPAPADATIGAFCRLPAFERAGDAEAGGEALIGHRSLGITQGALLVVERAHEMSWSRASLVILDKVNDSPTLMLVLNVVPSHVPFLSSASRAR